MNTKRLMTLMLIPMICIVFTAHASWAGSAAAHRLEGAIIGIGALIVTKAIIDSHDNAHPIAPQHAAAAGYHRHHRSPSGYWKVQKEWVSGQYKKVWNPGHYNRRGDWIPGHWQRVEIKPGCWMKKRVWVPYN